MAENSLYLLSFTNDERAERTGCEERDFGRVGGVKGDCSPVPSEMAEKIRLSVFIFAWLVLAASEVIRTTNNNERLIS